MPLRKTAPTLKKSCMISLAKHWDLICYSVHSTKEMNELMESEGYLEFQGPWILRDFPSTILEDLMHIIRTTRSLTRKYLHLLLREQLLKMNLSFGIGEVYYGFRFLPRCKRLLDLDLGYLQDVEPSHIISIIPHLTALVNLNLRMSSANDALLRRVADCCPNLRELNLQSTFVTDNAMQSLCGDGESCGVASVGGCLKLQRLIITETRVTWSGAYTVVHGLPCLTDFDFDKIFQVFEHLDPRALVDGHPRILKLKSFYTTTPSIRGESIDTASVLCPNAEILSVMNCWIDNDAFYKFMQFEKLKTLSIFNVSYDALDYEEGIAPLLLIIGHTLENLILSKFKSVDLLSLGKCCPRLKKIAFNGIENWHWELRTSEHGADEGIFSLLTNVELWLESDNHCTSHPVLLQLLQNSILLENLLIKKSAAFDLTMLRKIWMTNPMRHLSRLTLDSCNGICGNALWELMHMDNELTTIRVWSCPKVNESDKRNLQNYAAQNNLYVYVEWFQ